MQFTSQVTGTSNTGVTWTAALGSISSTGLYTAPKNPTTDTVSAISVADATKYANAAVMIDNAAVWTVSRQQPVTSQYYANSIYTTPLPADVGSHLAPNTDAIINNVYGSGVSTAYTVLTNLASQSTAAAQMAFYYSSASDPVYKVLPSACTSVPTNDTYNPVGKYFHITSGASPSAQNNDSFLLIWDQSTDLDPTPGGRILSFWKPHTPLLRCNCTTTSCADTNASCQISISLGDGWGRYCEVGYPAQSDVSGLDKSSGAYASLHAQPAAGFLRDEEIMTGTVNHALLLNTNCTSPPYVVFPATGYGVMQCSGTGDDANHPHQGSLIYIDSGYDCSRLPHWQQGVCTAMQTYGGYITDTASSSDGGGFGIVRAEGGMSYASAGLSWPFLDYIAGQGGNGLVLRGSPINGANLPFLNMPGVQNHLHVADPCVAKAMAGMSAAQGACP